MRYEKGREHDERWRTERGPKIVASWRKWWRRRKKKEGGWHGGSENTEGERRGRAARHK